MRPECLALEARCPTGESADLSDAKLLLVIIEDGLMRDSSPVTSFRHSPVPTLFQPSGSTGCLVSLFSLFPSPGMPMNGMRARTCAAAK